ncbi:MAG: MltA domain-containing protein [Paracoccaceae bacterium]
MMAGRWFKRLALLAGLALVTPHAGNAQSLQFLTFDQLQNWQADNHLAALRVFRAGCGRIRGNTYSHAQDWAMPCAAASGVVEEPFAARLFFESWFEPALITDGNQPQFTAYFEPELPGSRQRTERFRYPLYRAPPEVAGGRHWASRAEIETQGLLRGRGLEIVWLDDPVDAFYVHVQGSARIRLPDNSLIRIAFGGRNGHQFRSAARELIRIGALSPNNATPDGLKRWVQANPQRGAAALLHNPSYIFFREIELAPSLGPVGAFQVPLTAMRSIAVDPRYIPLGAPVWLEMNAGGESLRSLMVAQDTGGDIRGAQRADIYFGEGADIGLRAGRIRYPGRAVTLLPRAAAARFQ